jgi:hypothetical protein
VNVKSEEENKQLMIATLPATYSACHFSSSAFKLKRENTNSRVEMEIFGDLLKRENSSGSWWMLFDVTKGWKL